MKPGGSLATSACGGLFGKRVTDYAKTDSTTDSIQQVVLLQRGGSKKGLHTWLGFNTAGTKTEKTAKENGNNGGTAAKKRKKRSPTF